MIGRRALSTLALSSIGGAPLVAGVGATKAAVRTGTAAARGGRALKSRTTGMHASMLRRNPGFAGKYPRANRATAFMARHPIATATAAYGTLSGYNSLPGSHVSRRNQDSAYLRRIRSHQQSSSLSRLVGSSTGAFA